MIGGEEETTTPPEFLTVDHGGGLKVIALGAEEAVAFATALHNQDYVMWCPTNALQFRIDVFGAKVLQQGWIEMNSGDKEWRDVPTETST